MKVMLETKAGTLDSTDLNAISTLSSYIKEDDNVGQDAIAILNKARNSYIFIIQNLIRILYDDCLTEYIGIDDEEFIHHVCKETGLSRKEYRKIMGLDEIDEEILANQKKLEYAENIKKYIGEVYRHIENDNTDIYHRFIPSEADKAFYQLIEIFGIKNLRGNRIFGFGTNEEMFTVVSWCEGDVYLIKCACRDDFDLKVADEIRNMIDQGVAP